MQRSPEALPSQEISTIQNISEQGIQQSRKVRSKHYGKMIPLKFDPITNQPKYILGPHFYVFIPTWMISLFLVIYFISSLRENISTLMLILCGFSSKFFLYFYLKVGFSEPGIASSAESLGHQQFTQRYCVPCKIIRPIGTLHCYYCDVCIAGMDHHCPWVGKCIGKNNICLFYKFLLSIGVTLGAFLIAALTAKPKIN